MGLDWGLLTLGNFHFSWGSSLATSTCSQLYFCFTSAQPTLLDTKFLSTNGSHCFLFSSCKSTSNGHGNLRKDALFLYNDDNDTNYVTRIHDTHGKRRRRDNDGNWIRINTDRPALTVLKDSPNAAKCFKNLSQPIFLYTVY